MQQLYKKEKISQEKAGLESLRQQVEESCAVKRSLSAEFLEGVWTLAERTAAAYQQGNKVLLMGNGGSAADAQHVAAEIVGRFRLQRKALPAMALTTNSSILTAVPNDSSPAFLVGSLVKQSVYTGRSIEGQYAARAQQATSGLSLGIFFLFCIIAAPISFLSSGNEA